MQRTESSENLYEFVNLYLSQLWPLLTQLEEVSPDEGADGLVHATETVLQNAQNQILEAIKAVEKRFCKIEIVFEGSNAVCVRKILRAVPGKALSETTSPKANENGDDGDEMPSRLAALSDPDVKKYDDLLSAIYEYLNHVSVDCPITYQHVDKLFKALRENPQELLTVARDKILPFLDGLPEIDKTIVGGEFGEYYCLDCLTNDERALMTPGCSGGRITKDEADRFDYSCARCGKRLSGGEASEQAGA